ncbi:MAG: Uma2 family endonuclease [Bacteroidota bacterium]
MEEVLKRLVNRNEYFRMAEVGILSPDDRLELLNGEIYEMSPVGSRHSSVVKKITKIIHDLSLSDVIVGVQDPISFDEYNEPEPDISVVKYRSDYYAKHHPQPKDTLFLIEVADSSISFDMEIKLPLYAQHNIPEYWIIDLKAERILIFKEASNGKYIHQYTRNANDEVLLLGKTVEVSEILNL